MTQGLTLYKKLQGECSGLTAELETADSTVNKNFKDCGVAKSTEAAAATEAENEQARVLKEWGIMMDFYNGNYTAKYTKYTKDEAKVKVHENDRKGEWKATHQIKCMLESYKVDGTFDGATADKCNGELNIQLDIGYPEHIPRSKPATPEFEAQTDTSKYENVCDARTEAPEYTCVERKVRPQPECAPYDLEQSTVHA